MAARISLSAQLEAALLRANKAEAHVRDLLIIGKDQQVALDTACTALRALQHQVDHMATTERAAPRKRNTVPSFSDRAIAYCRDNQCNSVPPSVVAAWRSETASA